MLKPATVTKNLMANISPTLKAYRLELSVFSEILLQVNGPSGIGRSQRLGDLYSLHRRRSELNGTLGLQ